MAVSGWVEPQDPRINAGAALPMRPAGLTRATAVPPCHHWAMASIEELLHELDQRLLDAIGGKSTPEGVAKLAEARAWLTNPDQPHGSGLTT